MIDLDDSNFDSIVMDTNKDVLVEFYAPCKSSICYLRVTDFYDFGLL